MATRVKKKKDDKPRKRRRKYLKDGSLSESTIQGDILDWLGTTELIFYRSNSGMVKSKYGVVYLAPPGWPDITVIMPSGHLLGLEVKSASGSPSNDQIVVAKLLTDSGAQYNIVRSLNDAKAAIAEALGKRACRIDGGPAVLQKREDSGPSRWMLHVAGSKKPKRLRSANKEAQRKVSPSRA
jgi:hypothetical protein